MITDSTVSISVSEISLTLGISVSIGKDMDRQNLQQSKNNHIVWGLTQVIAVSRNMFKTLSLEAAGASITGHKHQEKMYRPESDTRMLNKASSAI